jgi:hypothetical protein
MCWNRRLLHSSLSHSNRCCCCCRRRRRRQQTAPHEGAEAAAEWLVPYGPLARLPTGGGGGVEDAVAQQSAGLAELLKQLLRPGRKQAAHAPADVAALRAPPPLEGLNEVTIKQGLDGALELGVWHEGDSNPRLLQ